MDDYIHVKQWTFFIHDFNGSLKLKLKKMVTITFPIYLWNEKRLRISDWAYISYTTRGLIY